MRPLTTSLRRYLWIDGRAGRGEWWTTMIVVLVVGVQLDVTGVFVRPLYGAGYSLDGVIRILAAGLLFWIDLASTIRRLHDRGKAGWNALPYAFPGFGWAWMVIECGMLPSQKGRNRYGQMPGSIEEERERLTLPDLLASFGERGASGPWSAQAARARPLKHARFEPDRPAAHPAMAHERTRTARQPVPRRSAVTRIADSSHARGKTILIIVVATVLGLAVATYMADNIVAHQSEKPTTTP